MGALSKTFSPAAKWPVHVFRAFFPGWKNFTESVVADAEVSSALEHGGIAFIVSPVTAALVDAAFSQLPQGDDLAGNSVKVLKTAMTPLVASGACFVAVSKAKASEVSAILGGGGEMSLSVLAGSAAIMGASFVYNGVDFKSLAQRMAGVANVENVEETKMTEISSSGMSIAENVKGSLNQVLRKVASKGLQHYRVMFPANLTMLGSVAAGFDLATATIIGVGAGIASVSIAPVAQKVHENSESVKKHIGEDTLLGKLARGGKPAFSAVSAATGAVVVPIIMKAVATGEMKSAAVVAAGAGVVALAALVRQGYVIDAKAENDADSGVFNEGASSPVAQEKGDKPMTLDL